MRSDEEVKRDYFVATERHDADGLEIPDPVPIEVPAGFKRPLSIHEQIHRALRSSEVRAAQAARGEETLEDSMDFDTGEDDPLPSSVHEQRFMQEEVVLAGSQELARRARIAEHERRKAEKAEAARKAAAAVVEPSVAPVGAPVPPKAA